MIYIYLKSPNSGKEIPVFHLCGSPCLVQTAPDSLPVAIKSLPPPTPVASPPPQEKMEIEHPKPVRKTQSTTYLGSCIQEHSKRAPKSPQVSFTESYVVFSLSPSAPYGASWSHRSRRMRCSSLFICLTVARNSSTFPSNLAFPRKPFQRSSPLFSAACSSPSPC